MYQGIKINHPRIIGVCYEARYLGKKYHENVERVFRISEYDTTDGVSGGQVNDKGDGAVLDSIMDHVEPAQLFGVWRKIEGPN